MKRLAFLAVVACLCGCALTGQARAGFIITFSQVGNNVEADGSGTINLSGLTLRATGASLPIGVQPAEVSLAGGVLLGIPPTQSIDLYGVATGPTSLGPGGFSPASSGTGDPVGEALFDNSGVGATGILVPHGYTSGTQETDSSTWDNTTISGLGLTPGTYTFTWGSGATADSLEVIIPAAAPEPASLTLLGLGAAGLLGYGWRKRKRMA